MSARLPMAEQAPALVCLNLQRCYLEPSDRFYTPRAADALVHIRSCLQWARAKGLAIVHVQTRLSGRNAPPIAGFEPHPTESVVFKNTPSLFDSRELAHGALSIRDALVVGFTGAHDCVAAAVDARRLGLRLVFITDAIASPRLSRHEPQIVDEVLGAILGEWSGVISANELLKRDLLLAAV